MSFHVLTSTYFDLDMFEQRAASGAGPRHMVTEVAKRLSADVHQPDKGAASLSSKFASTIYANAAQWDAARRAVNAMNTGDVVFCSGQDVGVCAAIAKRTTRKSVLIAMSAMEPTARRFSYLMTGLRLDKQINVYVVNDQHKRRALETQFGVDESKILVVPEQTDERFFEPLKAPVASEQGRPLLVSVGREQRDYRTLAAAIEVLDVDVEICAVSPNASDKQVIAMPDVVPPNMAFNDYSFDELKDLYQRSDAVVVSLLENKSSAGLTVLMEAVACRKPVIITTNDGLARQFVDRGLALGVEPNDEEGMREAIERILDDPRGANAMAIKAHDYFLEHHTSDVYVETLSSRLETLGVTVGSPEPLRRAA